MKFPLILSLLSVCMASHAQAHAQNLAAAGSVGLAGQALPLSAAPDPALNWRDPQWLSRQRLSSPWRYQLGLEQQVRSPMQLGPQAAVREAVWAGVSYDLTQRLRGGVEAPMLQRDSGWASRMAFERSKQTGVAGLRGAFSYQLSSQSRLMVKPQAHRVMMSYAANW